MLTTTERTLHISDDKLILWIAFVNPNLFDINVTDKLTNTSYRVAEYDGCKYSILNEKSFNGIFVMSVKQNPGIIIEIRNFISFHQPESQSFKAMRHRISNKFNTWFHHQVNSFKTKKK